MSNRDDTNINEGESYVEPLEEDNDTPFSAPDDPINDMSDEVERRQEATKIDSTHQAFDADIDSHEFYDEGNSGAAEQSEPNAGDSVVNYDPEKDNRKQD